MLKFPISTNKDLTLSDLRIALINYIISQQNKTLLLIIVEDINQHKTKESKEQETINTLKKFAINTENRVNQSKNLNIYKQLSANLVKEQKAFICFCEEDSKCNNNCQELNKDEIKKRSQEEYSIKIKKPTKVISFNDTLNGIVSTETYNIDNFTILNNKGLPTQTFASAIDNMSMGITNIIKDKKYLIDTLKELYIQEELSYNSDVKYTHLESIDGADITIKYLFQEGFLPDAIINYIISLYYETPKKIFYLPEVIEWFNLEKIKKEKLKFNIEELKKINKKYLKAMDSKKLSTIFGFADSDIGEILKLYLENLSTIKELDTIIVNIFSKKECNSEMKALSNIIKKAPMISNYNEFIEYLSKESNLNNETLLSSLSQLILGKNNPKMLEKIFKYINPYLLEVTKCH